MAHVEPDGFPAEFIALVTHSRAVAAVGAVQGLTTALVLGRREECSVQYNAFRSLVFSHGSRVERKHFIMIISQKCAYTRQTFDMIAQRCSAASELS